MGRLGGQVGLVVGAGRGLGKAIALMLAREGAGVAVASRTGAEVEAVAREIGARGGHALAAQGDASDETDARKMIDLTVSRFGRLDILVVCAGAALMKSLPEVTARDWDDIMRSNVRSVFLTNQAALPVMMKQRSGLIVNVASRVGVEGSARVIAYSTAKAAVIGFSRALAKEAKTHGVRVACLCPGPMDTPMRWQATPDLDRGKVIAPEVVAEMVVHMAMHPGVLMEEVLVPVSVAY